MYGLEGDWNWIGAKASSTVVTNFASYDVNWLASVRGRTGIALDATLFYLTGGVAFGQVQNNFAFLDTANVVRTSFPQDSDVFAPNWTARAEFRYTDLGKVAPVAWQELISAHEQPAQLQRFIGPGTSWRQL